MSKTYYVYFLTNQGNNVLYTGVTNDIERRVLEHNNAPVVGAYCNTPLQGCLVNLSAGWPA
ncbi:MAG: hypothetical protein A3J65_02710 [Candidatus Buchananbacteria bacterium RIFCSPHIGHO2_02_FULL_45_11b]|uniref:GIY-YIG domain-containing protein n=2 Tax=Candidatus Buchananiibacteriota TaxID=1817903 RepID=A0A1G1YG01_9BACT|nr:MAG: hypothetical protein A2663_01555 [Candidatus Buchananbacteria bacterium RIFCSPHIGHO2_01_FULL_46_12]OGY51219.1 MAG: hypothetical protein A3J65_02710 [Candidatus Buchananbacteria bacterium RIFCSPHIGHO2_02_FULL_45_11b]